MKIKSLVLSGLLAISIAIVSLAPTGCTTSSSVDASGQTNTVRKVDPVRTANVIAASAETSALIAMRNDAKTRAYFSAATSTISLLLNDGKFDAQAVRESLAQINVGENDDTWLAITAGLGIYQIYFGEVVAQRLDQNEYVRPVLQGMRDGFLRALLQDVKPNTPPATAAKP